MACAELSDYLTLGNVKNSVNMPCVTLAHKKANRVGIFYEAGAETEGAVLALLAGADLAKATRGAVSYVIAEKDEAFDLEKINAVGGVIRAISY